MMLITHHLHLHTRNSIFTEEFLQNKGLDDTSGSGWPINPGYENICIVAMMSISDVVDLSC